MNQSISASAAQAGASHEQIAKALKETMKVTVEIFDWGVDPLWDQHKPVSIDLSGAITIGANIIHSFIALITQSTAQSRPGPAYYEVRITVSDIKIFVLNWSAPEKECKPVAKILRSCRRNFQQTLFGDVL